MESEIRRCISEHAPYEAEYRVVWLDGSVHWIAGRGLIQYEAQGEPLRMLGITMEITDRKLREEQIIKLTRLYAVLSQVNEAIVRSQDTDALYSEVCRIVAEKG